jgi:GTPase SAR1 family protein
MQDISLTPMLAQEEGFRLDIFEKFLSEADGVIFLYDITNKNSFDLITQHGYLLTYNSRRKETARGKPYPTSRQRFGCVLAGNKLGIVEKDPGKRQVSEEQAADWAGMHARKHYEVDTFRRDGLEEVVRGLLKSIEREEQRDKEDLESSLEERWEEDQWDMWGQKLEPWGEYKAMKTTSSKKVEEKSQDGEKKGLSRSFSKLRNALPRFRSKTKAPVQQHIEQTP